MLHYNKKEDVGMSREKEGDIFSPLFFGRVPCEFVPILKRFVSNISCGILVFLLMYKTSWRE